MNQDDRDILKVAFAMFFIVLPIIYTLDVIWLRIT